MKQAAVHERPARAIVRTPADAGERIRELRVERGWRQQDLAERMARSQRYVSLLERGEIAHPCVAARDALARVLDVDRADIFGDLERKWAEKEETLSLGDAAAYLSVTQKTLRQAVADEKVACQQVGRPTGDRNDRFEFTIDALERAKEKYLCKKDGCTRIALGESGGCEAHGHAMVQAGVPISDAHRAAISRANKGRPRPDSSTRFTRLHEAKRDEADQAKREHGLIDVDDIAEARGIGRQSIVARVSVGLLEPVRLPDVTTLSGRSRLFFRPEDAAWPKRGDGGSRAWKLGQGFARARVTGTRAKRKWHSIWKTGNLGRLGGKKRGYTRLQARGVVAMADADTTLGYGRLAERSGLTVKQVRAVMREAHLYR